jgi:hypothetical protein
MASSPCDVWLLGRHRLVCGDSTNAEDVERVLAGVRPHLMVTDPPYGVNYDPAWRETAGLTDGSVIAKGEGPQRRSGRLARGLGAPAAALCTAAGQVLSRSVADSPSEFGSSPRTRKGPSG